MSNIIPYLAAVLVCIIGFAAHRASLCTVLAVEELLTTRRAYMLISFVKSIVWVIGITFLAASLQFETQTSVHGWALSPYTIIGGLMFGFGATINGGCAFSTLTRLGGGNLGMMTSLTGFFLGAGLFGLAVSHGVATPVITPTILPFSHKPWFLPVLIILICWMIYETIKLARPNPQRNWVQRLLAPRYRLSAAAALLGICNGLLFLMISDWPYTRLLGQYAQHMTTGIEPPRLVLWVLFFALLAGMGLSAWYSKRFLWQWKPQRQWTAYCAGGFSMGFGARMIPGGNDALILHGIPSLSQHALPAFLAIVVGIGITLTCLRIFGNEIPQIDCSGDICNPKVQ